MSIPSTNYGKIIDQLRKDRKISRDDLVDGIMSKRNYQRFTSGETSIPGSKLSLLLDKMKLDYYLVNQFIQEEQNDSSDRFKEAFILVMQLKFKEAYIKLSTIDKDSIVEHSAKQEYEFIDLLCRIELKSISNNEIIDNLQRIINFPDILDFKTINIIEFNALIKLNNYLTKVNDCRILEFFHNIAIKNDTKILSKDTSKTTIIYATLAKGYYNTGSYELAVEVCDKGISYSRNSLITQGVVNLFAYKALALQKMLKKHEAVNSAIQAYLLLLFEDNTDKLEIFKSILEKNLEIKFDEIIQIKKGIS